MQFTIEEEAINKGDLEVSISTFYFSFYVAMFYLCHAFDAVVYSLWF